MKKIKALKKVKNDKDVETVMSASILESEPLIFPKSKYKIRPKVFRRRCSNNKKLKNTNKNKLKIYKKKISQKKNFI